MDTATEDQLGIIFDDVDPADEDWTEMDDAEVYHAAKAGVPQAMKELERRRNPA